MKSIAPRRSGGNAADELFAAVYREPDADAPRAALARFLRRVGDPRGELIELQLAGSIDRKGRKRIAALIHKYRDRWLGPLAPVLQKASVRWERGFVSAGRLAVPRSGTKSMAGWIGLPALATLRRLDLDTGAVVLPYAWRERFIFQSPLRGLREIRGLPRQVLGRLLKSRVPWALETIECDLGNAGTREDVYAEEIREGFASARGVPHLRALTLTFGGPNLPARYDWLWNTEAGRRLRLLRVYRESFALTMWQPALVEHASEIGLERFVAHAISELCLERTNGTWSRLTGKLGRLVQVGRRDLQMTLDRLGDAVREVAVTGFRRR